MKNYFFLYVLFISFLYSCKEEEGRGQYAMDNIPPGEVKDIQVNNTPGGANISYTIPSDEDLLYVKVDYQLDNGQAMQAKASAYTNSLKVEGLGKSHEQTVKVTAVDRSNNESAPVSVIIHPLDAPIYEVLGSLKIANDFGGIRLDWENPLRTDVVLTISTPDATNDLVEVESFYSNAKTGFGNLRGFPAEEQVFSVHIRDRWGNRTDTIIGNYLPLYEEKLDNKKFQKWNPSSIPYVDLADQGWTILKLWDNSLANPGFSFPSNVALPHSFTFDLGQLAKISRFKLFQRATNDQLYTGGNVKKFKLYGSNHPGVSDDVSTWVFLGDFDSYKPSGLPVGKTSAEDMAYAGVAGEDYNIETNPPPVRYLRFIIEKTWGGSNAMQIMELQFFGALQN